MSKLKMKTISAQNNICNNTKYLFENVKKNKHLLIVKMQFMVALRGFHLL